MIEDDYNTCPLSTVLKYCMIHKLRYMTLPEMHSTCSMVFRIVKSVKISLVIALPPGMVSVPLV